MRPIPKITKGIAIITLLFMCNILCHSQNKDSGDDFDQLISYMKHIKVFQSTYPQEKVYVHFDNTGYFEGECMYFKTYVVRTDNGKPTDISKVLYVDLLCPSGYVIQQKKLKIVDGMANGDFMLDSIASTGFFEVRAYTRYMLNFGDQTAFSRVFPIFNKPKREGDYEHPEIDKFGYYQRLPERDFPEDSIATLSPADQKKKKARGYQVNIYPEGGKLVKGLYSHVAFSVCDPEHHPADLIGEVIDANGNTLTIVSTDKSGRGFFDIVPTTQKSRIIFTTPNKKTIEFDMPDAEPEGIVMTTDPVSHDDVIVDIQATESMSNELMGLTVMNNGNIYITETIDLSSVRSLDLIRNMLRPGVNQVTLFDRNGHIHAERLIFTYPKPSPSDSILTIKTSGPLSPCKKVKMSIQTQPGAHISFSAMDYDNLVDGKSGNINTYMLLGSDVQGYISNPEYYFESDDLQHRLAADSLMLFNGWRRYDWEVMSDVSAWRNRIQPVEDGLYIYGHLKPTWSKLKKKHPVGGVDMEMYLYNESGAHAYGSSVTDSTGFYAFRIPDDAYGNWNLQILTKIKNKLKSFAVTIDRQFKPKARYVTDSEADVIPLPQIDDPAISDIDVEAFDLINDHRATMTQTGDGQYNISTATIKAKKTSWKDHKNPAWDEYNARLHANIYYNCKEIMEEIDDRGEVPPTFYDWLIANNSNFEGSYHTILTYSKRPIIWIVNNKHYATSYLTGTRESVDFNPFLNDSDFNPNNYMNPINHIYLNDWVTVFKGFMDELRSIYIWSDMNSRQDPVLIYMFTEPYVSTASKKGRRRTYFHGYDKPTKFRTDDYGIIPPHPDDYRRTLWWEPDVVADSDGKANIEFFNNSTCTKIYVSAEGMTPDGKFVSTK